MTSPRIRVEFIVLMALLMSITALSIDTILPALGVIGRAFDVNTTSAKQWLITMTFLGVGFGQLFTGALSDSFGRKPVMYFGFVVFIAASVLSVMASSYEVLVCSRFLQGVGLSAPRTLTTAIIRDCYHGDLMAKVMSFVAMTFILVPAIAPSLGVLILHYANWQAIFYVQILIAVIGVVWFALRQAETLPTEQREKLNIRLFTHSSVVFFKQTSSVMYTLALGVSMGGFFTFLSTAEAIFIGQYNKADQFPYLFALVALSMGCSMLLNGKYVVRFGMEKMVRMASVAFTVVPIVYLVLFYQIGNPPLAVLVMFLALQVFSIGFIFGNLTTLSMEPLGRIAGMASAITGFVSSMVAVAFAGSVGHFIADTALPLFVGFALSGGLLMLLLYWVRRY